MSLIPDRIAFATHALTHLGPRWAWFRVRYALQRKTGALARRTPAVAWHSLPALPLAIPASVSSALDRDSHMGGQASTTCSALAEAEAILAGRFRLFSFHEVNAGLRPDWHCNPLTGERAPADRHWTALGDFAFGDIKGIWELSRFPWAFALARAYAKTHDNCVAERFWSLFEHWLEQNPPNLGPNWMCGQEATFRLIAVLFAVDAFADSPATTPLRREACARFVLATGRRIAANLDYALSQSNNHGISECIGLLTATIVLPRCVETDGWRRRAMRSLERQLAELVYPDGGFAQHSAVYHGVLLDDLRWIMALLTSAGEAVPQWLSTAQTRASAFLAALMDPETGVVPLYGANDGSNVLCNGADVPHSRVSATASAPSAQHFPNAGCLVWRTPAARLFLRCPTRFRHRPSQADMLHVDISYRGVPIAHDAGTYSYNTPGRFAGALKEAAVHNTVTFDGCEPLRKVSRFLYLPWPRGIARWRGNAFTAENDAWRGLGVRHVRVVSAPADSLFVIGDTITAVGRHRARVHWLLADVPYDFAPEDQRIVLHTAAGDVVLSWQPEGAANLVSSLVRADPQSCRGWWSPHYLHAAPSLSLVIEFDVVGPAVLTTKFNG